MSTHALAEALTDVFLRQCSACGRRFYKEEGCNSMTCVCGRRMCYVCRGRIYAGASHFCRCAGRCCDGCHLYTDVAARDADLMAAKSADFMAAEQTPPQIPESGPLRC